MNNIDKVSQSNFTKKLRKKRPLRELQLVATCLYNIFVIELGSLYIKCVICNRLFCPCARLKGD